MNILLTDSIDFLSNFILYLLYYISLQSCAGGGGGGGGSGGAGAGGNCRSVTKDCDVTCGEGTFEFIEICPGKGVRREYRPCTKPVSMSCIHLVSMVVCYYLSGVKCKK